MFPSPCGVSFILMWRKHQRNKFRKWKFPSPCGVSFILIWKKLLRTVVKR